MKELLKSKKITQTELAERLGVSQRLVSYWCTKGREPSATMMSKIAQILGVPIDQIVSWFVKSDCCEVGNEAR